MIKNILFLFFLFTIAFSCTEQNKGSDGKGSQSGEKAQKNDVGGDYGTFTDPRDEQVYRTIEIAGMTWFADNLNFEKEGSICWDLKDEYCEKYGRMYSWNSLMNVCPEGWHISTDSEWMDLEKEMGMDETKLDKRSVMRGKLPQLLKDGDTGLDILLGGTWSNVNGEISYKNLGKIAIYWSPGNEMEEAWTRTFYDSQVGRQTERLEDYVKNYVRCVKNK